MSNIFNPEPIPSPLPRGKTLSDYKLGDYTLKAIQVYYGGEWVTLPMSKPRSKANNCYNGNIIKKYSNWRGNR